MVLVTPVMGTLASYSVFMLKSLVQQARLVGLLHAGATTASPPKSKPDITPRRREVVHIMSGGTKVSVRLSKL